MAARIKLTLAAALLALALYPLASYAVYGGVWVPADGYGDGDGFWLGVSPVHAIHNHTGSEVYARHGSVGRLKDFDGRDDIRASICDNHLNFSDAMAVTERVTADGYVERQARTYDGNGVDPGCGVEIIGFSGERHSAYETPDFEGFSGNSNHKGF